MDIDCWIKFQISENFKCLNFSSIACNWVTRASFALRVCVNLDQPSRPRCTYPRTIDSSIDSSTEFIIVALTRGLAVQPLSKHCVQSWNILHISSCPIHSIAFTTHTYINWYQSTVHEEGKSTCGGRKIKKGFASFWIESYNLSGENFMHIFL